MGAFFSFLYGTVAYLLFLATFLYAIGFIGNIFVPKSIDSSPSSPIGQALLFAIGCTGYILIGIWFEERDPVAQFGDRYLRYRRQVGMLVPGRRGP